MLMAATSARSLKAATRAEDQLAQRRVPLDLGPFLGVELAGLVESLVGDAELADVVQQRRPAKPATAQRIHRQFARLIRSENRATRSLWPLV